MRPARSGSAEGRIVALVPAAGRGVRLGRAIPKAFIPVGDTSMITLAVAGLLASKVVDEIIVMVPDEYLPQARELLADQPQVRVIIGGAERIDSVRMGIAACPDAAFYLVHDAARPLTPPEVMVRVVTELRSGHAAVIPAIAVADTIKTVDAAGMVRGTLKRAELRAVQTPQGFTAELLRAAHAADVTATDDAGLVEQLGEPVRVVPGDPRAFKITTPWDLQLAELLHRPAAL